MTFTTTPEDIERIRTSSNPHAELLQLADSKIVYHVPTVGSWDPFRANLINGVYHDFRSELAMPKGQMINDLRALGEPELAILVIDGIFDEDPGTSWENKKE